MKNYIFGLTAAFLLTFSWIQTGFAFDTTTFTADEPAFFDISEVTVAEVHFLPSEIIHFDSSLLVSLSWIQDAPENDLYYFEVLRKGPKDSVFTILTTNSDDIFLTDTAFMDELTDNGIYTYKVIVRNVVNDSIFETETVVNH